MPDFEAGEDDVLEQQQPAADPQAPVAAAGGAGEDADAGAAGDEADIEAPEADALEQRREVRPSGETRRYPTLPAEADEADAAEQAVEVETDEDEYR